MNFQWHDEFVALCALFASGDLNEEEWALLQVHLAYCDSCRVVFEQYQHVADNVMPVIASSVYSEREEKTDNPPFSLASAEQSLMSRLDLLTKAEEAPNRRGQVPMAALIAACVVGISCWMGVHLERSKKHSNTSTIAVMNVERPQKPSVPPVGGGSNLESRLELAQNEVLTLRQRLNSVESQHRQADSMASQTEQQLQAERGEREKISEERDSLTQQLSLAQSEAQSLRGKSTETSAIIAQQTARANDLEAKLHGVDAALGEKDSLLALDKEFLAHDREIRDLIGARNLYIADIYDVAQNGQTSTPFGRIFYTKDRSLVFYGYDLDKQAGIKQSVAFQAWGSGDDKQNVSLGLFYQDETHKKWVLRFNDTKTLARLNMVFVTAEPQGGSAKPTGKRLLMAYLQVQPNHP